MESPLKSSAGTLTHSPPFLISRLLSANACDLFAASTDPLMSEPPKNTAYHSPLLGHALDLCRTRDGASRAASVHRTFHGPLQPRSAGCNGTSGWAGFPSVFPF